MPLSQSNIVKLMEKVDSTFTSVTGQSISFIDGQGRSVFPFNFNLFTDFCKYIIESPKGSVKCMECNQFFLKSSETQPAVIQCHIGLTMMSTPIVVNGRCNYSITSGQVILEGTEGKFYNNLEKNARELGLDYDELVKRAGNLKVLTETEVLSRIQFLSVLAEYISITETQLGLRNKYLEELEERYELEQKLKEIEFKFLQAQISPHFLFNTLNLLARTAMQEKAVKTADLIYDLSDLLRWGFKNKESICTLEEEFTHIRSYLQIQKARLGDILDTRIDISPEITDFILPVLTILPLVENAVVHGIEDSEKRVNITVEAKKEGKFVMVRVKDSGLGMDRQVVDSIRDNNTMGIGLKNVQERLKLFFGADFTLEIDSRPSEGTCISIKLPLEDGEIIAENSHRRR